MWRAATVGATTIVARPTKELQGEGLPMFNSYRLEGGALGEGAAAEGRFNQRLDFLPKT